MGRSLGLRAVSALVIDTKSIKGMSSWEVFGINPNCGCGGQKNYFLAEALLERSVNAMLWT